MWLIDLVKWVFSGWKRPEKADPLEMRRADFAELGSQWKEMLNQSLKQSRLALSRVATLDKHLADCQSRSAEYHRELLAAEAKCDERVAAMEARIRKLESD